MLDPAIGTGEARDPGAHFVQFYERDEFLVTQVADFLDAALRAGDVAIAIATPEHRAELSRQLNGFGRRDGANAWYSGKLVLLDAQETLSRFMVGDEPDESLFQQVVGALIADASCNRTRGVRAFGEMVALLCAEGRRGAAVRLEQLWNELGEKYAFSLFCGYPMRLFADAADSAAFRQVCAAHTHVHPAETCRVPAGGDGALATTIAALQQKAAALEGEVARRTAAEKTLRQREKELSDFIENAAEGLHRVGADGHILWANRAELDLLGYAADEYIGHHIAEFYVDAGVIGDILRRLHAGETLRDQPAALRHKDGSVRHVLMNSNAFFENGDLLYTRCFTRDVTDQVRAKRVLEAADGERAKLLDDLESASRAKDEFLAMLGHELRNPLSPIVTALQLMKMRGDTQTQKEQAVIQRQVQHLVRLVDDLLDVSKITRGKVELRKETIEIAQVLAKAVEMASMLFEQRNHRLSIDVPAMGLLWHGDPVRLAQVVSNLLTNAARYTDVGGDICLSARREGTEVVVVSVRDNGCGISPQMLPKIFELFFQGKRTVDRTEGGLGIGLALVKNLVEMHHGSVAAMSDGPGQGSEFVIRLPLDVPAAQAMHKAVHTAGLLPVSPHPQRVLIVDDNVDGADSLGKLMVASGHLVRVVHDPVAALRVTDHFRPDVAFLDIGLPAMDGYELALRLRSKLRARPCRFIAMSGYGQDADRERSGSAGFEQHLVKPVDMKALFALMEPPRLGQSLPKSTRNSEGRQQTQECSLPRRRE